MKTRALMAAAIALSAMATAGSTFADHSYSDEPLPVSTKSRAEVRADLDRARAEGLIMDSERGYSNEWARPGASGVAGSRYSGRTREEVKAETKEYMKNYKSSIDDMYGR